MRTPATQRPRLTTLAVAASIATAMTLLIAACAGGEERAKGTPKDTGGGDAPMRVTSAFADGARIPDSFAGKRSGGDNVSPPLAWEDTPQGVRSYAVTVIDRHPVAGDFVHWAVVDIPPETTSLAEGASGALPGGRELRNTAGMTGWFGPTPPPGTGPHDYEFTVSALDIPSLEGPEMPTEAQLSSAMEGHAIASSTITGTYGR